MSRPIGGGAFSSILTATGTSPQILLTITSEFNSFISTTNHATKTMTVNGVFYDGTILEVGKIKSKIKEHGACTSSSVSFRISDTNGQMKTAMDLTILERAVAGVYLYYEGTGLGNAIPLIIGNVVGPVTWDETNRTVSFSVESRIEEQDVGFAPTTDDFADLDPDADGIPWPMIFGAVAHSPCVKVHKRAQGTLIKSIQLFKSPPYLDVTTADRNDAVLDVPDVYSLTDEFTLGEKNVLYIENLSTFPASSIGSQLTILIDSVRFVGYADPADTSKQKFIVTRANAPKYTTLSFGPRDSTNYPAAASSNYRAAWLAADGISIANCEVYLTTVAGKVWYNYCVGQMGRRCDFRNIFISPVTGLQTLITDVNTMAEVYPISKCGMIHDVESDLWAYKYGFTKPPTIGRRSYSWGKALLSKMAADSMSWWRADADAVVWPITNDADVYIASLVQLSEVKAVYAKRKVKDQSGKTKTIFAPIPTSYYTVQLSSSYPVVGQHATGIIFTTPLLSYQDQGWEDAIYVSARSTVGPNLSDIIKFIVKNFTTLSVEPSSFSAVHGLVRNANFTLFDKRDALKVIEEIARQARCGLILDSGLVEIRFLAKQPFLPTLTFQDNNVDLKGGIERTFTPLQEISTKVIATWTPDYREKNPAVHLNEKATQQIEHIVKAVVPDARRSFSTTQYAIYENNVDLFGTRRPQEETIFVFNAIEPVEEMVSFWGYRNSNCWQKIILRGFPDGLLLQPYDLVSILFSDSSILGAPLLGIVTATEFEYKDMSVTCEIEIPRKAGSFALDYANYWPNNTF